MSTTLESRSTQHAMRPRRVADVARSFRPDIEALRAIAVLVVVLYHAGVPFLSGGYVGVDVFFVISGFLITTHLVGELTKTGTVKLGRFYARRARRLLPAAALVAVVTVTVTWAGVSGLLAAEVGWDALWSALFAMNIYLAVSGVDYGANQDPSPLQHYWSLSVEEQFYLVWPLLMLLVALGGRWVAKRRAARAGTEVGTGYARGPIAVVITAIMVASFVYSEHLLATMPTMAYFLAPSRAWELGLGALLAIATPWLARQRWLHGSFWVSAGLVLIVGSAFVMTDATPFPGTAALFPTVGVALVIMGGTTRASTVERYALDIRPMQGIGRVSYGWYLWHWPMLILAPMVLDETFSLTENLIVVGAALVFAMWTYITYEDPVRRAESLRPSKRSFAVGGLAIGTVAATAAGAIALGPMAYRTGDFVAEVAPNAITEAVAAGAAMDIVPGNVDPSLDEASKDKPDLDAADGISCMVGLSTATISEEDGASCVAGGTEGGSETVVVVGDSHAYHWVPALREIAIEREWELVSMTKSGCTLNDVDLINTQLERDYWECYEWREDAMERIDELDPSMIITTAAVFSEKADETFTDRWVQGVTTTTTQLVDTGAPVYVIEDTPYPRVDIPTCLAQHVQDPTACALPPVEAYSDPERRERTAEAASAAGAAIIDPSAWFCTADLCPAISGNVIVYSDNSHMSATYSKTLATVLGDELPESL